MKKFFALSLIMVAFATVASFAAETTIQKTGKIFFRPSDRVYGSADVPFFYSKGCLVDGSSGFVPSANDKELVFNEKTEWYEVPVKDAIPDTDTMVCIYSKDRLSVSARVKVFDFDKNENLYIVGVDKYFAYSDIKVPTIFWKVPENWPISSVEDERMVKNAVDGWYSIPKISVVKPEFFYVVDTAGYKDTTVYSTYQDNQISECALYAEEDVDFAYYDCEFYPNILDTVDVDTVESSDPDNPLYLYELKLSKKIPILDTVSVDSLVSAAFQRNTEVVYDTVYTEYSYSKYSLDNGKVNLEYVVDTVKIDSSDWLVTHDDEDIYYTLRFRSVQTSVKVVGEEYKILFDMRMLAPQVLDRRFVGATMYNAPVFYERLDEYFNLNAFKEDTVYIMEDPLNKGKTMVTYKKPKVQFLYVKLPSSMDWFSAVPMLSFDNGKTGKLMTHSEEFCRWHRTAFVNEDIASMKGLIYFANDTSLSQGVKAGTTTPIALKNLFAKGDTIYLDAVKGMYGTEPPEIDQTSCVVSLTGIVYDTDVSLNKFFSVYTPEGMLIDTTKKETNEYTEACVGVHHGIVQDTLDKNSKPILNKGSENAVTCFADDEKAFNSLFNYTKGVNEGSCYSFELYQWADNRWGYSSDNEITGSSKTGVLLGGFYPVEDTTGKNVFTDPLPAARTKREAEGPTVADSLPEGISSLEKVCNGPGWDGGIDCEGKFVSDDPGAVMWNWMVASNGTERWVNERHNQHFCFESHASFVYHKGQNFSAIGDDDIWVFFAGKLAIDNGGAHLATPGYVNLDKITDKKGQKLVEGETYDFDMFFCDRRTTMSNMTFKTNIYLSQKERAALLDPCKVHDDKDFFSDPSSAKPKSGDQLNVVTEIAENIVIMPYGRTLQIARGTLGGKYTVFDMQGNMVRSGELSAGVTNVQMSQPGSYIVKIGSFAKAVRVK